MNISPNSSILSFSSHIPKIGNRIKPLAILVTALAVGILILGYCYYFCPGLKNWLWRAEAPSAKEEPKIAKVEQKTPTLSFSELLDNSKKFSSRIPFPTSDNLIESFAITEDLQKEVIEHAESSQPLLPRRVWSFIPKFLELKRKHGTAKEKALYVDLTPEQFVDRLIKKRPLMFMGAADSYLLRSGKSGAGGFEDIGKDDERADLSLSDYQSYFEMSLSAFLSMIIPTHFINTGSRKNHGIKGIEGTYEPKGIYAAMVGTRFEKPGLMEWQTMMVTPKQNTSLNGYGLNADPLDPKTMELRLWAELYGSRMGKVYAFPTYAEALADKSGRYLQTSQGLLDTTIYKERMRLSLESFLLDADQRAESAGKKAYLHIVGLGLGVWMVHPAQTDLLLDVYASLLKERRFEHIADINFSWFNADHCGEAGDQDFIDSKGHPIRVHFSKRDPADKLKGEDEGKLLIAQYAWDSNAYPGNEYWAGSLSASGDPAAACCSLIPELQNPEINPYLSGKNLKIAL